MHSSISLSPYELLYRAAQLHSDKTSVVADDGELTFGELISKAHVFRQRYLANYRGEAVLILLPKCTDYMVAIAATLGSGNYYCPCDPDQPVDRIRKIIETLNPVITITLSEMVPGIESLKPDMEVVYVDKDPCKSDPSPDSCHYDLPEGIVDTDPSLSLIHI